MVCVSGSSPKPNPPELPLAQPLNPDAAPYPPLKPATSKMGPSWVLSKPYYRHQPVVYQLSSPPTLVYAPTSEGSFMSSPPFWAHYPTNYRLYYYHHYYYCHPKAVVGPPTGSAQQEAVRGTIGHLPPRFSQPGKRGSMVPKRSTQSGPSSATSVIGKGKEKEKEKEEVDVDLQGKTTLMIKNVPNQFGRNDLMVILDKHCIEENNKAMADGHPVWSSYDFLYLPMDFGKRANLGYAFVNFTSEVAAKRFWVAFNEFKWKVSWKTCEVTKAFIQGKEGFLKHFRNSVFPCHTNNYLPAVFRPPRDGVTRSKPTPVGRRSSPAKSSTGDRKRKVV